MFSLLYHYILNPKKTLAYHTALNPIPAFLLTLILVSSTYSLHTLSLNHFIFTTAMSTIGLILGLTLLSLLWDLSAQLLNCPAKSLTLLSWTGLTLLPSLLAVPLHLIIDTTLITTATSIAILSLQILTIQSLYNTSLKKAIAIFCFPLLIIPSLLIAFILIASVLFP